MKKKRKEFRTGRQAEDMLALHARRQADRHRDRQSVSQSGRQAYRQAGNLETVSSLSVGLSTIQVGDSQGILRLRGGIRLIR